MAAHQMNVLQWALYRPELKAMLQNKSQMTFQSIDLMIIVSTVDKQSGNMPTNDSRYY